VFFANAALLVLQLVAGRLLAPFIGSSLETWTSVIGMFLAGISAGNWYGGRIADRAASGRTLRRLLWLGCAAMLSALGVAKLLGEGTLIRPLGLYPRIALTSFLICFPSAFVLSLTTPVAIKLLLPDVRKTGRVVGLVYALGTLGSLVGNFATGFGFMAYYGITAIVLGTAGMLFLLSLLVPPGRAESPAAWDENEIPIDSGTAKDAISIPAACCVVFIASFCSMGLEIGASRLLAPSVGMSIYTWTGIIGVMLAGIVAGNYLGGWIADRWPARDTLGASLFWCGLLTLLVIVLFALGSHYQESIDQWIQKRVTVKQNVNGTETEDTSNLLQAKIIVYALGLFFLPMLAFGSISPQATRLAVRDWGHAGRVAGRVYAWSCAGAIAGTFATGWFLIGRFGVLWLFLGISVGMILLALPVGASWRKPRELLGSAIVLGAVAAAVWLGKDGYLQLRRDAVYLKETNYYLISVTSKDDTDTSRDFVLDHLIHSHVKGQPVQRNGNPSWEADLSYMGYGHEQIQAEFARSAAAAHEVPHFLVIGGGGYTLPRWIDKYIPQATMEVVEIDPGVTEAVHASLGMPRDTKIKTYNFDGRQFIQENALPGHYHLIIQDAVNDLSVPWHIMTKQYNDAVKKALADDGIYLLTIIDSFSEGRLLPAAVETMRKTFPHVYLLVDNPESKDEDDLWNSQSRGVYVIAGTPRELKLDELKAMLAKQGVNDMMTSMLSPQRLDEWLKERKPVVLTDDFAPVDNMMAETFRKR